VTSINVECIFSKGHFLLLHLHSHLSVQSTHTLMCVAAWSSTGFVKTSDITVATCVPEAAGEEEESESDWDAIPIYSLAYSLLPAVYTTIDN
jgi:hypothetical protein